MTEIAEVTGIFTVLNIIPVACSAVNDFICSRFSLWMLMDLILAWFINYTTSFVNPITLCKLAYVVTILPCMKYIRQDFYYSQSFTAHMKT